LDLCFIWEEHGHFGIILDAVDVGLDNIEFCELGSESIGLIE